MYKRLLRKLKCLMGYYDTYRYHKISGCSSPRNSMRVSVLPLRKASAHTPLKGSTMKLIYCPHCHDIRKLHHRSIVCICGRSGGFYHEDGLHAEITGSAIPLGINGSTFVKALANRPKEGMGEEFAAFVIPKKCPTVTENKYFEVDTP